MKRNVFKGLVVGLVGGLAASWTMDRFQEAWFAVATPNQGSDNAEGTPQQSDDENATVKAGSAISETLLHHSLTPSEKKLAGSAVHYAVGATSGMVYGVSAEFFPEVTLCFGTAFGSVFWLTVDEGMVPLLGLAKGPTEYPLSTHIYAFASHLVFGATVEGVRRLLRP